MKKQETKKLQQEENTNNKQNLSFKFELKMLQQQQKKSLFLERKQRNQKIQTWNLLA